MLFLLLVTIQTQFASGGKVNHLESWLPPAALPGANLLKRLPNRFSFLVSRVCGGDLARGTRDKARPPLGVRGSIPWPPEAFFKN